MKDLYSENCETLIKEIKEDTINGKIFHVHRLEELIWLRYPYYPKQFTDSMQSLRKFQWQFFTKIGQIIQICMEPQKTLSS